MNKLQKPPAIIFQVLTIIVTLLFIIFANVGQI